MTLYAANAVTHPVTDYGPDPNNPAGSIFREVMLRLHGWLVPAVVCADGAEETTFHGYANTMQNFQGAANPASTAVTFRNGGNAEVSSAIVEGPMGDPARRIFADRLRRRSAQ